MKYKSPVGDMLLAADDIGLFGVWLTNEKYFASALGQDYIETSTPILEAGKAWLDQYFEGKVPTVKVPLHFVGTEFRKLVWEFLLEIPYGKTITYGELAKKVAAKKGLRQMSAQAVGGAVGHNELSIIVPCHRVVGANGNLTGYAGGLDRKVFFLKLEGAYKDDFYLPK